jgi:hypothetical protein
MAAVQRTAEVGWTGTIARGTGRARGGSGALGNLPIAAAVTVRGTQGQDQPGGAHRGGARGRLRPGGAAGRTWLPGVAGTPGQRRDRRARHPGGAARVLGISAA